MPTITWTCSTCLKVLEEIVDPSVDPIVVTVYWCAKCKEPMIPVVV